MNIAPPRTDAFPVSEEARTITVDAPAKINLSLHVVGRRADGYHLLESLVVFTRFGDRVTVGGTADQFSVDGPFAEDVPVDGGNLVLRARDGLRDFASQQRSGSAALSADYFDITSRSTLPRSVLPDISPARREISSFPAEARSATLAIGESRAAGVIFPLAGEMSGRTEGGNVECGGSERLRFGHFAKCNPTAIHLAKHLPIASGIGGGSSDAAATLRALNTLWNLHLSDDQLREIALPLGADLPMCLAALPLIARGVGEQLELLSDFPTLNLVLVNPGIGVSTPQVFKHLASPDNAPLPPLSSSPDFIALLHWLATTRNDLEPAATALAPPINVALQALRNQGAAFARMSGSGATCFGLFETESAARLAADAIRRAEPHWFVAATQTNH